MDRVLNGKSSLAKDIRRDYLLYFMLLPGIIYFVIFKYGPMFGLVVAFKDYAPSLGMLGSKWVGLKHFERLFGDPQFFNIFENTIILAIYNIVFYFPLPIIIALMLNEVVNDRYKRAVQSAVYLPHFVSWVVVAGITYTLLSNQGGAVNEILMEKGKEPINFLGSESWFRPLITLQVMWKESGWGTIIFLAALTNVDTQLYEAAKIDGANRWQQLWHITLPSIKSTIVILLILRMGGFLNTGFEQIFLMLNSMNRNVGEVFDTYVYTAAMRNGQISYASAIGLFKSVVSFVLVVITNRIAKALGEEGVY
jgi:putative aldouronate transport system permease protein